MNRFLWTMIAWLALMAAAPAADSARIREDFDWGWRFHKGDAAGAQTPTFDDAAWRKVNLPHDWSIEGPYSPDNTTGGPGGWLPAGLGWYRKTFTVPESLRGRQIAVEFDGIYMNSEVWLNGQRVGGWPYGYTSFQCDLTPFVKFGEPNVLAVRVDNSRQRNSRWYSGSGIYRHTWLTATPSVHVAQWGTYVTTPEVKPEAATVRVRTQVKNDSGAELGAVKLVSEILDASGAVVATKESTAVIAVGAEHEFDDTLQLSSPKLWSPSTPTLYRLRSTVENVGRVFVPAPSNGGEPIVTKVPVFLTDTYETTFGVRTIEFNADRGFLLNGQPVKLLGMCLHHDGGPVGAAVPEAVWERRLRLLKDMGCNAVRMSHNPMAPEMYDLCDRLGLLVMDEAFDEWRAGKGQIDTGYRVYFNEWHERDLVSLVRRNRNHPSIVIWSVGNEIGEQRQPRGHEVLKLLVDIVHREDPTRPVTAGLDNIFTNRGHAPEAFTDLLDVVGYNYVDRWGDRRETFFGPDRALYPDRKFIGTEDTGLGGPRGSYTFRPLAERTTAPVGAAWASQMIRAEQLWKFNRTHDYVSGYFMWTGIDYLGEAGMWPRKNATSGVLDTCGFPKDGYYFWQSQWTEKPMLHLFPHWNWAGREGEALPVVAYTNCDVVELFLNGRSLGAKALEFPRQGTSTGWNTYAGPRVFATTADLHLSWDVPYAPGTLKAVGYRNGQVVAEQEVATAGPPAALVVEADRAVLRADGRDVAHLTVKVVDAKGVVVPDADNLVAFQVEGAGRLLGLDNGNPTDTTGYQENARRNFHGLGLALVQTHRGQPGAIKVRATAEGLAPGEVTLQAEAATVPALVFPVVER